MRPILLSILALACGAAGGCQAHTSRGKWTPLPSDAEMKFLEVAAAQPGGADIVRRYMDSRQSFGLDIATASTDGLEVVSSSITLAADPVTLKPTFSVSRGNDISTRAADLVTAGGNAFAQGMNASANLASKVGAGMATGGGAPLLDTLIGAATANAQAGDPTLLNTLTQRVEAARKLVAPAPKPAP